MNINTETIREEFNRDTYWTRIHCGSDEGDKQTIVLVCASQEYLSDKFKLRTPIEKSHLEEWLSDVVKKCENEGVGIFQKPVHYYVYANSQDGHTNGLNFLQNEVTP